MQNLIDDRPDEGIFRVHRSIFSDPELFELEMQHLFEGGWLFLGLESQVRAPHDFMLTRMGRQSILLMRDGKGQLGAFYNTCPHRGAAICNLRRGNERLHVCPYHSWSFTSDGRNKAIKLKASGEYSEAFLTENHDLKPIARLESYRGLIFGSLVHDVPELVDYLGDAAKVLDLALDSSDEGLEFVPGEVTFTFNGNWKMQLENCVDGYHVSSVHPTYLKVAEMRAQAGQGSDSGLDAIWERSKHLTADTAEGTLSGTFSFTNGHALLWSMSGKPNRAHPLFERREELAERFGPSRRDWMMASRNLSIFPNVQFAENFSSQARIMRPIAPDKTEMVTFCVAPIGEDRKARSMRIRQYEDFFNPTGLAIPDDMAVYERCQEGHGITSDPWLQGYSRGMCGDHERAMEIAGDIDIRPTNGVAGSAHMYDETIFHGYYRAWRNRIAPALKTASSTEKSHVESIA